MKHTHISIMCNELPFLKQKLQFLYDNFHQLIFVDYNLYSKSNSIDGSIEYIESFKDPENKITLIKDFNPNDIKQYRGVSFVEKQKMFACASKYIKDDTDIVWATDLDEFFHKDLINKVEELYNNDPKLQSIDLPHKIFVYNQYNVYDKPDFYIAPRITKHEKNFLYGHCDFEKYGKTIKLNDECLFHYAFIGYYRCKFKFECIYNNIRFDHNLWLNTYLNALNDKLQYVELQHSNTHLNLYSSKYNGEHPEYINLNQMCDDLNHI